MTPKQEWIPKMRCEICAKCRKVRVDNEALCRHCYPKGAK